MDTHAWVCAPRVTRVPRPTKPRIRHPLFDMKEEANTKHGGTETAKQAIHTKLLSLSRTRSG